MADSKPVDRLMIASNRMLTMGVEHQGGTAGIGIRLELPAGLRTRK